MNKSFMLLTAACLTIASISGCKKNTMPSESTAQTESVSQSASSEQTEPPETQIQTESPKAEVTGILYIGSQDNFKEYDFTGEVTPENLISGIADLTGWNLTLADTVTTGKGGMTVCFAEDSFIKTGPPQVQKDEFHAYDQTSFAEMVLDSIKKTLQQNFVDTFVGGNPDNLDIYFCILNDQGETIDIAFVESEAFVPMDQPYQGIIIE